MRWPSARISLMHAGRVLVCDTPTRVIEAEGARYLEDAFGRMEEARSRDHGGAGLGLPLASRIVARHGGTLELDDSELGGARFVVTLPVVATDDH